MGLRPILRHGLSTNTHYELRVTPRQLLLRALQGAPPLLVGAGAGAAKCALRRGLIDKLDAVYVGWRS